MKKYASLKKQIFKSNNLSLVPIRYEDRYKIMNWRNEQIYHLRQSKPLEKKDQDHYFNNIIEDFFNNPTPQQILFSYLEDDICIGYGGLVNINWYDERAEMSFLLDSSLKKNKDNYNNYFSIFIHLIKEIAFKEIKLNRIFTETYAFRSNHIQVLENNKFKIEGIMKEHISMKEEGRFYDSIIHGFLKEHYER